MRILSFDIHVGISVKVVWESIFKSKIKNSCNEMGDFVKYPEAAEAAEAAEADRLPIELGS